MRGSVRDSTHVPTSVAASRNDSRSHHGAEVWIWSIPLSVLATHR